MFRWAPRVSGEAQSLDGSSPRRSTGPSRTPEPPNAGRAKRSNRKLRASRRPRTCVAQAQQRTEILHTALVPWTTCEAHASTCTMRASCGKVAPERARRAGGPDPGRRRPAQPAEGKRQAPGKQVRYITPSPSNVDYYNTANVSPSIATTQATTRGQNIRKHYCDRGCS